MTSRLNNTALTIIGSAEKLFALRGYHAVSIREISKDAAVNISAVSYYFGSKENLLKAVFEERIKSYEIDQNCKFSKHTGPVQNLKNFINYVVHNFFLCPYFTNICLQLLLIDSENSVLNTVLAINQQNEQLLANIIFKGQNEGFFKFGLNSAMLYSSMKGIITDAISKASLQQIPDDGFISNPHQFDKKFVAGVSNDVENFILSFVSKTELNLFEDNMV